MKITVTGDARMHATATDHTASRAGANWTVTWLPGQALTQEQAVTALKIAATARRARTADGPARARLAGWAAELGLPGPRAARMATAPVPSAGSGPARQAARRTPVPGQAASAAA
jgi:hypothetical protein